MVLAHTLNNGANRDFQSSPCLCCVLCELAASRTRQNKVTPCISASYPNISMVHNRETNIPVHRLSSIYIYMYTLHCAVYHHAAGQVTTCYPVWRRTMSRTAARYAIVPGVKPCHEGHETVSCAAQHHDRRRAASASRREFRRTEKQTQGKRLY